MIKCKCIGREMTIEVDGAVQQVAADCCEVISAIYRKVPSPTRELFKACVLMAVTHEESPMWRLDRREDSVTFCSSKDELARQMAELQHKGRSEGGGSSVTRVDLTKAQCAELANYLRGVLNNGMGAGSFDKIEMLVLARRALMTAEELPEVSVPPIPPPEPANPAAPSTISRSGAAEAAEFKRQTLARLEAYRRTDGLTSFTPLAELCDEVDGKAVTPEMLGRMLGRERFPVTVWRAVAAALDKMERKKGVDEDGKDD